MKPESGSEIRNPSRGWTREKGSGFSEAGLRFWISGSASMFSGYLRGSVMASGLVEALMIFSSRVMAPVGTASRGPC